MINNSHESKSIMWSMRKLDIDHNSLGFVSRIFWEIEHSLGESRIWKDK